MALDALDAILVHLDAENSPRDPIQRRELLADMLWRRDRTQAADLRLVLADLRQVEAILKTRVADIADAEALLAETLPKLARVVAVLEGSCPVCGGIGGSHLQRNCSGSRRSGVTPT